jgi:predicted negative regulator of RcsB-dependent stress response
MIYEQALYGTQSEDEKRLLETELINQNRQTPYAAMAALLEAQRLVQNGQLAPAEQSLSFALEHTSDSALRQIVRVRLARVQLANGQPQAALTTLDTLDDPVFLPLIAEIQGDTYTVLNDTEKARDAYQLAISQRPPNDRGLLELKLQHVMTTKSDPDAKI